MVKNRKRIEKAWFPVSQFSSPELFGRYADRISALPERHEFSKADLLIPQFRLFKERALKSITPLLTS